jgi:cyclopropane-fatty-acyl-phospholipid synthase
MKSRTFDSSSEIDRFVPRSYSPKKDSSIGYRATRLIATAMSNVQMTFAESYVNGMEIPDSAFRGILHSKMPVLFRYHPALLAPYEWVLHDSERLAESAHELMDTQYDRPQAMPNQMLGDLPLIHLKYSMGLWEKGA